MTNDTTPSLLEKDAPKQGHGELTFPLSEYSDMAPHKPGEGGALNANYTLVDAACKVTYDFSRKGLEYGKDFRFDDQGRTVFGFDGVKFKFHINDHEPYPVSPDTASG